MRVLVCDDSAFMRRAIRSMLESDPDVEVVGVAHNGEQAVELTKRHQPDVVTLDIEMPVMDGLTALGKIMSECPTHVVMVSSLTTKGSQAALDALRLGAADVFAKDHSTVSANINEIRDDLLRRVRALASSRKPAARGEPRVSSKPASPAKAPVNKTALPRVDGADVELIVIGSSTGGPPVVERILRAVPGTNRVPIVVAQHMPRMFTESMAGRLDELCGPAVVHLRPGMQLQAGAIHVAPGGENVHLKRSASGRLSVRIDREPATTVYFPSVDELFRSAAETMGRKVLGVVLTGMGEDGGEGSVAVKRHGGRVVVQDEASCVVYGMPRAVVNRGASAGMGSPAAIAEFLGAVCGERRAAA